MKQLRDGYSSDDLPSSQTLSNALQNNRRVNIAYIAYIASKSPAENVGRLDACNKKHSLHSFTFTDAFAVTMRPSQIIHIT